MLLNGKLFPAWTEQDIEIILLNPEDYREDERLDYKASFSHLEIPNGVVDRKNLIQVKKDEFQNDICSFANADGGLLIYGISDDKGTPSKIKGIDVPSGNTDKFELDRRNELTAIQPVTPNIKFKFLELNNGKYVVIISVEQGMYTPYLIRNENKHYIFKKRYGNGKRDMSYNEIRNAFNQSLSLSDAIDKLRQKRIDEVIDAKHEPFAILHIIPAQFLEQQSFQKMYLKAQNGNCNL